ncbi:MAG TPA: hypothetical protein DEP84_07605, partial [Chloroflexi bacterium]|nr:hypothetical protein [Chloroflexota bacterium]
GAARRVSAPAPVALLRADGYNDQLLSRLRSGWSLAGMPSVAGKRILIKPNLVDHVANHPAATDARLVAATIDLLRGAGAAEIIVGDGPAFRRDGWAVAGETGLLEVLEARRIPFVDLNYDDPAPVPVRDGWLRTSAENAPALWLPGSVRRANLIVSLPKLKTHHWAGVSLSMKNLFGVVPGARYGWPKNMLHINGLDASILAVLSTLPPVVGIVDGIVGMQGDGPVYGEPVEHGVLAFSADVVALDHVGTRLAGLDPAMIVHLRLAAWAGLGQAHRIELRGDPVDQLIRAYQAPPTRETLAG